jgi:hypothetical protein
MRGIGTHLDKYTSKYGLRKVVLLCKRSNVTTKHLKFKFP